MNSAQRAHFLFTDQSHHRRRSCVNNVFIVKEFIFVTVGNDEERDHPLLVGRGTSALTSSWDEEHNNNNNMNH